MILRLLPWTGPEGKPCYLMADQGSSYLSHLADDLEAMQLAAAEDLLDYIGKALSAGTVSEFELRLMVSRLTQALRDTVRVAESRGARGPLADPEDEDEGEAEGPTGDGAGGPPGPRAASRADVAREIVG